MPERIRRNGKTYELGKRLWWFRYFSSRNINGCGVEVSQVHWSNCYIVLLSFYYTEKFNTRESFHKCIILVKYIKVSFDLFNMSTAVCHVFTIGKRHTKVQLFLHSLLFRAQQNWENIREISSISPFLYVQSLLLLSTSKDDIFFSEWISLTVTSQFTLSATPVRK